LSTILNINWITLYICVTVAQESSCLISQGNWLLRENTSSFIVTREHGLKRKRSTVTVTWARSGLKLIELREDGNKTTTVCTELKGSCALCLLCNWMNAEIRMKIIHRLFLDHMHVRVVRETRDSWTPLAYRNYFSYICTWQWISIIR